MPSNEKVGAELNDVDAVTRYHETTKHHSYRPARSLGYMDWANQPNPFRWYEGLTRLKLPFTGQDLGAAHIDLYRREENPVRDFSLQNLSLFLELSLGISAWKSAGGNKWALRMNPSSGNLHPTEGYVVTLENIAGDPGVFHYSPYLHALEPRVLFPEKVCARLKNHFLVDGFLFGLTSIFWREAWKYGERAFRYCNHDLGHAIAAAGFAANLLGWEITYLSEASDEDVAAVLGLTQTTWIEGEAEYPEILCYAHPSHAKDVPTNLPPELVSEISGLPFQGRPNRLSEDHIDWEIISETADAAPKPRTPKQRWFAPHRPFFPGDESRIRAAQIIRQRRSALAFDGATSISESQFLTMLDKTLPREDTVPFDFKLGPVRVHLLIFMHRVRGLTPGLYMFLRDEAGFERLKTACRPEFSWKRAKAGVPLFLLKEGPFMREATAVSCQQDIAGDSAFSLGMIADFRRSVEEAPYLYRHLYWETGMVGQVLYLEAEAHGLRATGIGCFFDDAVHNLMGLKDNQFQTLYHFTIGTPVEDQRLQTWPPYAHLTSATPSGEEGEAEGDYNPSPEPLQTTHATRSKTESDLDI